MSKITVNRRPLNNLIRGLETMMDDIVEEALDDVVSEAKARVHVISGKTRDSIHREGHTVQAGYGALYEEFGTRFRSPHPFLTPAYRVVLDHVDKRVRDRIRNVVR